MAIRIPNASGSYFTIVTNLPTSAISVFFRVKRHTDRNATSWLGTVGSSATSSWADTSVASIGDNTQIHGVATAADGDALQAFAFWDWTSPNIGLSMDSATWYNVAIICYGTDAFPKIKYAVRAHPTGTLYTYDRDDAWFEGTYDNFTNARITIGAGAGGSNPSACDFADIWVYNTAYTSDTDIEAQFDTIAAALSGPWSSLSCRGKASVAAAAEDETNSNDWTVVGSGITLIDTDNPVFGPTVYGSDVFPSDEAAAVPEDPDGLTVTVLSSSTIKCDWNDNASTETSYVVEIQELGTEVWSLAGSTGPNTETLTVYNLDPATTYKFRVYASGMGGQSGYTDEVEATTKGLFARGFAHSSAAGVTDCTVSVYFEAAAGEVHGLPISYGTTGQAFDSALYTVSGTQMARITVPIEQVSNRVGQTGTNDIPVLADGDDVQMYVQATVAGTARNTPIFYATVVEE